MKRTRKIILGIVTGLVCLCVAASCFSVISNQTLPDPPDQTDRLSELDKARLAETIHLKASLGSDVWPGWAESAVPFLVWNEDTSFLVDFPEPPTDWEAVPDDEFLGKPYFRQPSVDPQNFAVKINGRLSASMATKWETDNFLIGQIKNTLPFPLNLIVPYRLIIMPSEVQMTGLLHEAFHVFQAEIAPEKLTKAEAIYQFEEPYFQMDTAMNEAWQEEISLLIDALAEPEEETSLMLVQTFLALRDNRREAVELSDDLIAFEQLLEWEEGLAKYAELVIWQEAGQSASYDPLPPMSEDSDFKAYATFEKRWSQEMQTMRNLATDENLVRFYYTGMVQAMLLDRHYPGWKDEIMAEEVWLETLLREVATN